jgi:HSP20 family protein
MPTIWRSPLFDIALPTRALLQALDETAPRAASREVREADGRYLVTLLVPGMKESDLDISVTPEGVSVRGERKIALPEGYTAVRRERDEYRVQRSYRFPKAIDADNAAATLKDGVLTLTIPWREQARKITVQAG